MLFGLLSVLLILLYMVNIMCFSFECMSFIVYMMYGFRVKNTSYFVYRYGRFMIFVIVEFFVCILCFCFFVLFLIFVILSVLCLSFFICFVLIKVFMCFFFGYIATFRFVARSIAAMTACRNGCVVDLFMFWVILILCVGLIIIV